MAILCSLKCILRIGTMTARRYVHNRNHLQSLQGSNLPKAFIDELAAILGPQRVSTSSALCLERGTDEGYHGAFPSQVVVTPESTEQVAHVVKACHRIRIPVVPRGTGTGLEGGVSAIKGGVCVDTSLMTDLVAVNAEDFDATVEAGMTHRTLNNRLRHTGLFFPVDPGADASLGGMAATSASGTNAVKYGTMRENVLNLEVVLPDGTVIHTAGPGRRAKKTSAGYNLTNLFVGSEGTLGIITKVTLRLYGIPEATRVVVLSFRCIENAVSTACGLVQANISAARIELLDEVAMMACNRYSAVDQREAPTLFIELHGTENTVDTAGAAVEEIALQNGVLECRYAVDAEQRKLLWKARHDVYYACLALRPGNRIMTSDVCVPISRLTQLISETKKDIVDSGSLVPIVGHVGDGNFHGLHVFNPNDKSERGKIEQLTERLMRRALSLGGTCTGEHGIGLGKMRVLRDEVGNNTLRVMKNIKCSIDPFNIMNPGKVIDEIN